MNLVNCLWFQKAVDNQVQATVSSVQSKFDLGGQDGLDPIKKRIKNAVSR